RRCIVAIDRPKRITSAPAPPRYVSGRSGFIMPREPEPQWWTLAEAGAWTVTHSEQMIARIDRNVSWENASRSCSAAADVHKAPHDADRAASAPRFWRMPVERGASARWGASKAFTTLLLSPRGIGNFSSSTAAQVPRALRCQHPRRTGGQTFA